MSDGSSRAVRRESPVPVERIGLVDFVIAGALAAATWLVSTLWEFPGLYPGVWNDAAVASFTRPASTLVPGYWTVLATGVFRWFGLGEGVPLLRLLGHLLLAGVAVLLYAVLREWLAFAMRMRPQYSRRRTLVMRVAAVLGTATFVAADPIWIAGQCLSETTILLALTLVAIESFFVFLRKGEIKYAYLSMLFLGLLAAESAAGFALLAVSAVVLGVLLKMMPVLETPFFRPAVMEIGKWHLTFIFLAALVVGIAVNAASFVLHGGVGAACGTIGDMPLKYLLDYWARLTGAGTPLGWLFWTSLCVLPLVVVTIRFPASADEDQFLSYASGLVFFFCGALVFSQSAFLPSLWFWTHFPMGSGYALALGMLGCAATLTLSLTILGVDSLCRNHARLARQFFGDPSEDGLEAPASAFASRSTDLVRRAGVVVIPVFLLLMLVPGRVKTTMREMLAIIDAAVEEIVREAGDASCLFTDGRLDAAIEMASARQGGSLRCYSLMGGEGRYAAYLRTRNMTDDEDVFSFSRDAGMGLRSWIRDRPERLKGVAALMGFDLWKRDGKPLPPMGGLLSRPAGFDAVERERGLAAAYALIRRVLAVYSQSGVRAVCTDETVRHLFLAVQWRLARMCIYRGEQSDLAGVSDSALAEAKLAKELNDRNSVYQNLLELMEQTSARLQQKLTVREGLQLALVRADFRLAKSYAETVLATDPENPDACFALGMHYLQDRQLLRAERYLTRCLMRNPREPAVYNNLAMIQIELGKLAEARRNVEKALALIPGSAAVLDTQKSLEEAERAARGAEPEK